MPRDPFEYVPPPEPPTEDPLISQDQWDAIERVLQYACSDSKFQEKAMRAIRQVVMYTPVSN